MASHDIEYRVCGGDLQYVEVRLDRGETVIAEAGAMIYLDDGVRFEVRAGDGTEPQKGLLGRLAGHAKRALSGETFFLTHFTNDADGPRRVALGSALPGSIVAIDLDEAGGRLLAERGAFLAAAMGTTVSVACTKNTGAGMLGGEGFLLQALQGDGMVFLHVGGAVIEQRIDGGRLLVDTGCIVALESTVEYSIERVALRSAFLGGEGMFLATLGGHGRVWLQSIPPTRLADALVATSPVLQDRLKDLEREMRSSK